MIKSTNSILNNNQQSFNDHKKKPSSETHLRFRPFDQNLSNSQPKGINLQPANTIPQTIVIIQYPEHTRILAHTHTHFVLLITSLGEGPQFRPFRRTLDVFPAINM